MVPKEVDYSKLGQRIRELRVSKGMTQADLGALVNCSNNHLSHIETGQCKVSLNMMLKLSYALETSLDYFLLDTPFATPKSIIDIEIAQKLDKCSAATLVVVNKSIDLFLELQNGIID